jgi:tetratricopeptide (TPR) repeat protein
MSIRCFRVPASLLIALAAALLAAATASEPRKLYAQDGTPLTQEQTEARNALNQGVEAFKRGQFDEAARLFDHAKQLDPRLLNARLYLATTYASQYIPGAPNEENLRNGRQAVEEFKGVLAVDAENLSAIDGVGSMLFQMAGAPYSPSLFLESKAYHQKHMQIQPDDPEPYYWIGVINWTLSFRGNAELRGRYNQKVRGKEVRDFDPLPTDLRAQYLRDFGPMIDEGIEALRHAISLRADYDDAMAYLNPMYRRKADAVATMTERARLNEMADDLLDQIKEIKQRRAQQRN